MFGFVGLWRISIRELISWVTARLIVETQFLIVIIASLYRRLSREPVFESRNSPVLTAVPKITAIITMRVFVGRSQPKQSGVHTVIFESADRLHMVRTLAVGWAIWKLAGKRFGPVGGAIVAMVAVGGYILLSRWLDENHPEAARLIN